ncbi:MAG TPA: citryl-CoA lyase [Steroidobacteraceae bacterium]|nr:citryl-CoA lyase [Steroidobacteraceae bacterium]
MKIGSQSDRNSAISASNAGSIVVRGRDLVGELVGRIGFTDHIWLLVTGAMPTAAQRRMLDATLVAIAEHGMVPSVVASRMTLAAAPEALQGAVAAGILGCGSVILGSAEAAGRLFAEIHARSGSTGAREAAAAVAKEYRAQSRAIPGYGHPLHKKIDPRAERLLAIAREEKVAGAHCEAAANVGEVLPSLTGKPLVINVSGAIAAVLLDAGFPLGALKGVPIIARTASLVAHLLEELERPVGFVMSHAAADAVGYDGVKPEGFEPGGT